MLGLSGPRSCISHFLYSVLINHTYVIVRAVPALAPTMLLIHAVL